MAKYRVEYAQVLTGSTEVEANDVDAAIDKSHEELEICDFIDDLMDTYVAVVWEIADDGTETIVWEA